MESVRGERDHKKSFGEGSTKTGLLSQKQGGGIPSGEGVKENKKGGRDESRGFPHSYGGENRDKRAIQRTIGSKKSAVVVKRPGKGRWSKQKREGKKAPQQ